MLHYILRILTHDGREAVEFILSLTLGLAGYVTAILSGKIQINGHSIWDRRLVWVTALMLGLSGGLLMLLALGEL